MGETESVFQKLQAEEEGANEDSRRVEQLFKKQNQRTPDEAQGKGTRNQSAQTPSSRKGTERVTAQRVVSQ